MPDLLVLFALAAVLLVVILSLLYAAGALYPPRRSMGYALGRGMACNPGDKGLAYEEWWLELEDGVQLPVWDIPAHSPPPGRDDGRKQLTLLFVHGWGQSRLDMLDRIEPWVESGSRLVLYDLRGHGDSRQVGLSSGKVSSTHPTHLGYREHLDLLELLEWLGEQPVVLVGWSMGAGIALRAAFADHGSASENKGIREVRGLILHAPYSDFASALKRRIRGLNLPGGPVVNLALFWLRLRLGIRRWREENPGNDAGKRELPVMIMHGSQDHISPPEEVTKVATSISELDADGETPQVKDFDRAGHHDLHTIDPALYAGLVRGFLKKISR